MEEGWLEPCKYCTYYIYIYHVYLYMWNPFLRGHSHEETTPLERPLDIENININVLICTS